MTRKSKKPASASAPAPYAPDRVAHRYEVARQDFAMATAYAEHLLEKGWHKHFAQCRGSVYMQQSAFTTAFVITYCRPFTSSNESNWPAFPYRSAKLTAQELALHKRLMDLRNEVFAHSETEQHKRTTVEHGGREWLLLSAPSFNLTREELTLAIQMLGKLEQAKPRIGP